MRLSNTLKYLIILFITVSVTIPSQVQANNNPRNVNKTESGEDKREQVQPHDKVADEENKPVTGNEEVKDDEDSDISRSSFNYFFYLIYKVKFEDVFKFPDRRSPQNSTGIKLMDINSLLDRLVQPKI
jgi:hypothetical protein